MASLGENTQLTHQGWHRPDLAAIPAIRLTGFFAHNGSEHVSKTWNQLCVTSRHLQGKQGMVHTSGIFIWFSTLIWLVQPHMSAKPPVFCKAFARLARHRPSPISKQWQCYGRQHKKPVSFKVMQSFLFWCSEWQIQESSTVNASYSAPHIPCRKLPRAAVHLVRNSLQNNKEILSAHWKTSRSCRKSLEAWIIILESSTVIRIGPPHLPATPVQVLPAWFDGWQEVLFVWGESPSCFAWGLIGGKIGKAYPNYSRWVTNDATAMHFHWGILTGWIKMSWLFPESCNLTLPIWNSGWPTIIKSLPDGIKWFAKLMAKSIFLRH